MQPSLAAPHNIAYFPLKDLICTETHFFFQHTSESRVVNANSAMDFEAQLCSFLIKIPFQR